MQSTERAVPLRKGRSVSAAVSRPYSLKSSYKNTAQRFYSILFVFVFIIGAKPPLSKPPPSTLYFRKFRADGPKRDNRTSPMIVSNNYVYAFCSHED